MNEQCCHGLTELPWTAVAGAQCLQWLHLWLGLVLSRLGLGSFFVFGSLFVG